MERIFPNGSLPVEQGCEVGQAGDHGERRPFGEERRLADADERDASQRGLLHVGLRIAGEESVGRGQAREPRGTRAMWKCFGASRVAP